MVHEMQQRIYLPDSENEEDKEGKDNIGESSRSSSSASGIDDLISIEDLRKVVSSPNSLSMSSKQDKDIPWKRLKRAK